MITRTITLAISAWLFLAPNSTPFQTSTSSWRFNKRRVHDGLNQNAAPFRRALAFTCRHAKVPDSTSDSIKVNNESVNGVSSEMEQLQIAFITGNKMKAREMQLILDKHGATRGEDDGSPCLVKLRVVNVDLPEIQEIDTHAIAKNKAIQGAQLAGGPCVVEDTSLQFHALGGMPGPFIKWFQETLGSIGLYKILSDYDDKSASAVCTLAFCPYPHADPVLFTGKTDGQIVAPVEGRGFGWDSIFVPDASIEGTPFSQMTTEEKNSLSHRGKAVRLWADWLGKNKQELFRRQEGGRGIGHKGLDFKTVSSEQ